MSLHQKLIIGLVLKIFEESMSVHQKLITDHVPKICKELMSVLKQSTPA